MRRALELARKAEGRTSPNPMVGAVIVKSGRVVGKGYHCRAGLPHAEIEALRKAGAKARGAELYINLEPCCHFGRTPPCVDAIIAAGIKKVIVGLLDPNPQVHGKGVRRLRRRGIQVTTGVLKDECERLNEVFVKFIRTRKPYVVLKAAVSLDGKIATQTGESKWITSTTAREIAHQIRDKVDAIMVGAGTVVRDDPWLTTRLKSGEVKHPVRIILDNQNLVPLTANVFKNSNSQRVIYVTGPKVYSSRVSVLTRRGVEILVLKEKNGFIDLKQLMRKLARMEITSVLIEGGAEINASALQEKIVDKVIFFVAPIIIGGKNAPGAFAGDGIYRLKDAFKIKSLTVSRVGKDLMLEGTF